MQKELYLGFYRKWAKQAENTEGTISYPHDCAYAAFYLMKAYFAKHGICLPNAHRPLIDRMKTEAALTRQDGQGHCPYSSYRLIFSIRIQVDYKLPVLSANQSAELKKELAILESIMKPEIGS